VLTCRIIVIMTNKLRYIIAFSFFAFSLSGQIQTDKEQINAINNFVNYTNECLHGMLITHRLFENYNQDINKYVDLEGYRLNFYNNRDLPWNIFQDPEHWFYEVSPEELFIQVKNNKSILPEKHYLSLSEKCIKHSWGNHKIK